MIELPKRKNNSDLDLSPLIDVIFLLLIFFMLTTTFNKNSSVKIDYAKGGEVNKITENIEILIDKEGNAFIEDKKIDKNKIVAYLKSKKISKDSPIKISADKSGKVEVLIGIIDMLRKEGFKSIGLGTDSNG